MFSYFSTVPKSQDARNQVLHYRERLKEFLTNFSLALPRLSLTKINEAARHSGLSSVRINVIKLAEEYHIEHAALYKNYYISLSEADFNEMMKNLTNYLVSEEFQVSETKNPEGVKELSVSWFDKPLV